ncbi:MAG: hypothetical protein ACFCD0_28750 [Gemmataceae bacterium]
MMGDPEYPNYLYKLLIEGIPPAWYMMIPLYFLGLLTLLFSMIVASRLAGGIDFGTIGFVLPRAAGLLAAVTIMNFFTCGALLTAPVWYFGLMFLFDMDRRQTRTLSKVNWATNLVWKALLTIMAL